MKERCGDRCGADVKREHRRSYWSSEARARYFASREWGKLKAAVRERSGGFCERCEKAPYEATHHLTYERMGREHVGDLQALCNPCHEFVSGVTDVDPCALSYSAFLDFYKDGRRFGAATTCRDRVQVLHGALAALHWMFCIDDSFLGDVEFQLNGWIPCLLDLTQSALDVPTDGGEFKAGVFPGARIRFGLANGSWHRIPEVSRVEVPNG